ncbi:unnamed protein product [Leuciscus chuanchicus]
MLGDYLAQPSFGALWAFIQASWAKAFELLPFRNYKQSDWTGSSDALRDEPAAVDSEPDDLNISMLSLDPPSEKKDVSFVPHSSTSASSTTTTTDEEEEQTWQERKWIVPHKTTFNAIQSSYLIPAIDEIFKEQQSAILDTLKAGTTERNEIHLSGDGRSDSPGYSAKYTTYSLMDDITDKVVHFELVQVTESSSSVAMESTGFRRALNKILDDNIGVSVVTTDRSPSIRKIMRVDYQNIHHEFDVWHVAKGMIKKLASLTRYKDNRALQPWIKSIGNHLWFTCSSCGGDPDELIKRWKSILHHICGVHSWIEDGEPKKCMHSELSSEEQRKKKWIDHTSRAFITLENLVLDKGLLKDLRQMALFKHTGKLEVFHSLLLKYCPKRIHFHYTSMLARTQLAVLDHNENVHRQQARTETACHWVPLALDVRLQFIRGKLNTTCKTLRLKSGENSGSSVRQTTSTDTLSRVELPSRSSLQGRSSSPRSEEIMCLSGVKLVDRLLDSSLTGSSPGLLSHRMGCDLGWPTAQSLFRLI